MIELLRCGISVVLFSSTEESVVNSFASAWVGLPFVRRALIEDRRFVPMLFEPLADAILELGARPIGYRELFDPLPLKV